MKHKIYLTVAERDLKKLEKIVNDSASDELSDLIKLLIEKDDTDKYIRHHVYLALSDISGFEPEKFNDDSDLKLDLGLGIYHKRALKSYFQHIVLDLGSTKPITVAECERLKTVQDCLKLVKSKL